MAEMINPPEAEIRAGSLRSKRGVLFKGTAAKCYHRILQHSTEKISPPLIVQRSDRFASVPIAGPPDPKRESDNDSGRDEHPVLSLESQKIELLNEKLHRFRPLLYAEYAYCLCKLAIFADGIYYFFMFPGPAPGGPNSRGCAILRSA